MLLFLISMCISWYEWSQTQLTQAFVIDLFETKSEIPWLINDWSIIHKLIVLGTSISYVKLVF